MYSEDIYYTFIRLRDQLYRCKTQPEQDKYTNIEMLQKKYITFSRFCWACEDYFSRRFQDEPTPETIQEIFDNCLDLSQRKCLKITLIWN